MRHKKVTPEVISDEQHDLPLAAPAPTVVVNINPPPPPAEPQLSAQTLAEMEAGRKALEKYR